MVTRIVCNSPGAMVSTQMSVFDGMSLVGMSSICQRFNKLANQGFKLRRLGICQVIPQARAVSIRNGVFLGMG